MTQLQFHYYFQNQDENGEFFNHHLTKIIENKDLQIAWCKIFPSQIPMHLIHSSTQTQFSTQFPTQSTQLPSQSFKPLNAIDLNTNFLDQPQIPCHNYNYLLNTSTWSPYTLPILKINGNTQLKEQLNVCHHYGLHTVVFEEYMSEIKDLFALASLIKNVNLHGNYWFRVRYQHASHSSRLSNSSSSSINADADADWMKWNQFRLLFGIGRESIQSLGLILELQENTPTNKLLNHKKIKSKIVNNIEKDDVIENEELIIKNDKINEINEKELSEKIEIDEELNEDINEDLNEDINEDLSEEFDDIIEDENIIFRWLAEPIQGISISNKAFIQKNNRYFLNMNCSQLLYDIFENHVTSSMISIIFNIDSQFDNVDSFLNVYEDFAICVQSIHLAVNMGHSDRIEDTSSHNVGNVNMREEKSELDLNLAIRSYANVLQEPLQPQSLSLSNLTYEMFEKDNVKYKNYEKAIELAMRDTRRKGIDQLIVMVVGAGRGPLVDATRRAAETLNILDQIQIFVVEKNPHCFQLLDAFCRDKWHNITIVKGDMRLWKPNSIKCHIMVSELLGSFSDNELCPECIYNAMHLLHEDAICIPQSYTSFLSPVSSIHILKNLLALKNDSKFEIPYVVNMPNAFIIDQELPIFTFTHGSEEINNIIENQNSKSNQEIIKKRFGKIAKISKNLNNINFSNNHNNHNNHNSFCSSNEVFIEDMTISQQFISNENCLITGLSGYFECQLYKSIYLSTCPHNSTEGLFSWFPIYFPLKDPMTVLKGEEVLVHISRMSDETCVWYEWAVCTESQQSMLHNANGCATKMFKY